MFGLSSLNNVSEFSDLDIILDSKLTFNLHLNYIINKANRMLGFIKRFSRDFRDPYVLKLLFVSFVRPILEYGCVVWSPYYSVHINRLEAVQRRFMRFCLRSFSWNNILPPYSQRLTLIKLPTITNHRKYLQFCFITNLINGCIISPAVLNRLNFNYSRTSLRLQHILYQPFSRSNYGVNSPLNQMIVIFNKYYIFLLSVHDYLKSESFKYIFYNE